MGTAEHLIAHVVVDIAAPCDRVWSVLLAPETPTKIMPVDEVLAPWRLGERFELPALQGEGER